MYMTKHTSLAFHSAGQGKHCSPGGSAVNEWKPFMMAPRTMNICLVLLVLLSMLSILQSCQLLVNFNKPA